MSDNQPFPGFDPEIMRRFEAGLPVDEGFFGLSKSGDGNSRKAVYRTTPHCDIFDLEDVDQRKRYEEIMQYAADGTARIIDSLVRDHPKTGNFRVIVHWADFKILPPGSDSAEKPDDPDIGTAVVASPASGEPAP